MRSLVLSNMRGRDGNRSSSVTLEHSATPVAAPPSKDGLVEASTQRKRGLVASGRCRSAAPTAPVGQRPPLAEAAVWRRISGRNVGVRSGSAADESGRVLRCREAD